MKLGEGFHELVLAHSGQIAEIDREELVVWLEFVFYGFEKGRHTLKARIGALKRMTLDC